MNTMADGARDRLVAQIGEALFGQPGLTLMELAEKVRGMRSPFLIEEEPLPADMRLGSSDYLDYLNDQPSPAGPGDALAMIDSKVVGDGRPVGMADLEQILLDPENQPSQFGTVPTGLLEKCEEMISDLVHQFGDRGCTCTFPEADCCAYARAEHYSRDGAAHG